MKEKDCINRQAVLDVLKKHWLSGTVAHRVIDEIGLSINALPSVTPEPPEDDDRKCMRCKHCIERGPGWANPYGCDAWTCEFEEKEEEA